VTTPPEAHLFEIWMAAQATAPAATVPTVAPTVAPPRRTAPRPPAGPPHVAAPAPPAVTLAALQAAGLVIPAAQRARLAEEWRVAASHLLRALRAAPVAPPLPANTIMVTSAKPGEGKSFASLNLAGRLSQDRMAETLLLDVDTKAGSLSDILGLSDRPGLFDLVADPERPAEELILATAIPGLAFLPVGRRPAAAGAAARTITRPVVAAIETLAHRFAQRVLVLDTPPCLATSDASTLAPAVALIAVIVEAERTQRHDLEATLDLLRPCPNIALVLNKLRSGSARGFGDYHDYYG
jgi:receptor protein-tyrosine kinase